MARSRLGRRIREVFRRDWLEVVLTVLGVLFLAIAAVFLASLVVILVHIADPEPSFEFGPGALHTSKLYGIVFFGFGTVITFATGWWLAGRAIRDRLGGLFRRDRH
jgi:hypothetical protein